MPSGKVHDRITVIASAVAAPVWWFAAPLVLGEPAADIKVIATLVGATLFSGLMMSPDLDLDSSIYRRWGPLRVLWWPYQKLVPHRSPISHSVVLGPTIRVIYFLGILFLLFRIITWVLRDVLPLDRNALTRHYFEWMVGLYTTYPHYFWALVIGLLLGDALHCGADTLVSNMKRKRR